MFILCRNGFFNVLFFVLWGLIKFMLFEVKINIGNVVNDFVSGVVLGVCLSILFFLVNVVKSYM